MPKVQVKKTRFWNFSVPSKVEFEVSSQNGMLVKNLELLLVLTEEITKQTETTQVGRFDL
jgi:hypothetical protein